MVTLFESLGNAAKSAFCALSGPLANALQLGGNLYIGVGGELQGEDLIDSAGLLRSAQNVACNRQPEPVAPALQPPFQGGQCPTTYRVETVSYVQIRFGVEETIQSGNVGFLDGPLSFEQTELSQTVFAASAGQIGIDVSNVPDVTALVSVNFSVTTLDGSPDDCGNLPVDPPNFQPDDWTTTLPVTYDDDSGNPVTISPRFDFRPTTQGPSGQLTVPFNITFEDGSSLFGDFNLSTGDVSFGTGNTADEGQPSPNVELEPEVNPEDLGVEVIGVRIISTISPTQKRATELAQDSPVPNLWVPYLGLAAFKYQLPSGTEVWGKDVPIKREDFVIWAERPAVNVAATPNSGVSFVVRPIVRTEDCPSDCC